MGKGVRHPGELVIDVNISLSLLLYVGVQGDV